jgi:ISXO2-like transposase domain
MLDRQSRQVCAKVVPNVKRETLQAEILKEIERCSKIYTDEWTGYGFLFPSLAFSCQSAYEILLFDPSESRLFIQVVLAKKEWRPGTLNERMVLLAPGDLRHERRSFGWGAQFFACSIRHEGRPPGRRTKPGVPASSLQPFPQIAEEPSPPSD